MKVREAIEILQNADPDTDIVLSSDEEGNSFRYPNISMGTMCDQYGELVECHPDDIKSGEYRDFEDTIFPAVVIW